MIESINVDVCSAGWASKSLFEPGQKAFLVKDVPCVAIELNYVIILLELRAANHTVDFDIKLAAVLNISHSLLLLTKNLRILNWLEELDSPFSLRLSHFFVLCLQCVIVLLVVPVLSVPEHLPVLGLAVYAAQEDWHGTNMRRDEQLGKDGIDRGCDDELFAAWAPFLIKHLL